MNTSTDLMNWQSFKKQLLQYPEKELQFQYSEGRWVSESYHITEIKQASVTSVDCGGTLNNWTEIIIQLWEPAQKQQERAMKVRKALAIIRQVEKVMSLDPLATVKIEFGNSQFDTRQMYPGEFLIDDDNLIINLSPDFTQCKAIERGGDCGNATEADVCCAPSEPKVELQTVKASACCTPGGGCC